MTVIVTDTGFGPMTWTGGFDGANVLELASDADLADPGRRWTADRDDPRGFPSFADGRGFTLARQLRLKGFEGRLRAFGHVIWPTNTPWRAAPALTRSKCPTSWPPASPKTSGSSAPTGKSHNYQARLRAAKSRPLSLTP